MDQKKQGQQSGNVKGQQQHQQGSQHKQDSPQSGQQKWQEPQTQNPNRQPVEGSRDTTGGHEKGSDFDRSKDLGDSGSDDLGGSDRSGGSSTGDLGGRDRSGGITNRELDSEMGEQDELPPRGSRQSDR